MCKGRWHSNGVPQSEFASFGGSRQAVTEGLWLHSKQSSTVRLPTQRSTPNKLHFPRVILEGATRPKDLARRTNNAQHRRGLFAPNSEQARRLRRIPSIRRAVRSSAATGYVGCLYNHRRAVPWCRRYKPKPTKNQIFAQDPSLRSRMTPNGVGRGKMLHNNGKPPCSHQPSPPSDREVSPKVTEGVPFVCA